MRSYLLVLILTCGFYSTYSQQVPAPGLLPQRVPPAPSSAALERYALIPVTESAGTPNISVPLYEIHSGQLTVPVTMSYHASGVRVNDKASWVGLGWSLNAGGVITRIIRGKADEQADGFRQNFKQIPPAGTIDCMDDYDLLTRIASNEVDYEPDLFAYNFLGQSGYFMQGNDGAFHSLPSQPLAITASGGDSTMVLRDAAGITYRFTTKEYTTVVVRPRIHYASAWYLDQIVSANKTDTIRFEYQGLSMTSTSVQQQHSVIAGLTNGNYLTSSIPDGFQENETIIYLQNQKLSKILFKEGHLEFLMPEWRKDVVGDKSLQEINVFSAHKQEARKQIRFYYSYFNSDKLQTSDAEEYLRLRLDSLAIRSPTLKNPAYSFTYSSVPLPGRTYGPRDHWGYYNGATQKYSGGNYSQPLLIPTTTVAGRYGAMVVGGINRQVNPIFTQAGLLTQIHYPTGGSQQFTYEANTVARQYRVPNPRTIINLSTSDAAATTITRCKTRTTTLHLTEPVRRVQYEAYASRTGGEGSDPTHDVANMTITDVTDPANTTVVAGPTADLETSINWSQVDSTNVTLKANHTYTLEVQACGTASARFIVSYELDQATYAQHNEVVGGLRLREQRIQASTQAPATIKRYYYHTPGSSLSSGYLINASWPAYSRQQVTRVCGSWGTTETGTKPPPPPVVEIIYTVVSSSSLGELEGLDQVTGYRSVTVVDSSSTGERAGKTVSEYSLENDGGSNMKPYPPTVLTFWKRGNLLTQQIYTSRPTGGENLIQKIKHHYTTVEAGTIVGFKAIVDASLDPCTFATAPPAYPVLPFAFMYTRQGFGWQYLDQTRQYRYAVGDTTSFQLTTTTYHYDNPRHQQPTLVETMLQGGQRQLTRSRYAADYDTTAISAAPAQALRALLRNHEVARLLEQTTLRVAATDTLVTQSSLLLPRRLATGAIVTDQQLTFRTLTPRLLRQFTPLAVRNGTLTYDKDYQPQVIFDSYDVFNNLLQQHRPMEPPTSYEWGYAGTQLVAQAQSAAYAQVATTSFEQGELGKWVAGGSGSGFVTSSAYTGRSSYQLTSQNRLQCTSLPAGSYQISCWLKAGDGMLAVNGQSLSYAGVQTLDGWKLYQRTFTLGSAAVVTLAGEGQVDELRLAPVGTHLTTLTYDPLVGMTSQTDANNRTTYYEYDALGRLLRTRDEQGHLLTQQEYHYGLQP